MMDLDEIYERLQRCDNTIEEHTPIIVGDRVIGCTIGENAKVTPIKCVLYSHFLEEEMMNTDDTYRIVFLRLSD
jgi:hypothetical protein